MAPFLDTPVVAGKVVRRRAEIGEFADGSPVTVPVVTAGGLRPGPTLYLQAGLHGDESTGIEICRRVIAELDPAELSGTFVAVPVANVPAHLTRARGYLHEERGPVDLNRSFPGNPHGLLSERLAHVLFRDFVQHADFTIDLHSALDGCDIAPYVYVIPDDDENGTLAARLKAAYTFGAPFVYHKPRGAKLGTSDMGKALSSQSDAAGIPTMTAEMGESNRVSWDAVPIGVRGVFNVLRAMGMLPGAPDLTAEPQRFTKISLVHASRGGGLRLSVAIGDTVASGDVIGEIVDVFGEPVEQLSAPADGFVLRVMRRASVGTGAEVAWIAS